MYNIMNYESHVTINLDKRHNKMNKLCEEKMEFLSWSLSLS